jgi:superfamily II DNA helicase RecQ
MPLTEAELKPVIQKAAELLKQGLQLKTFQYDGLISVIQQHMTIVFARTGMGKSIIFLLISILYQLLKKKGENMSIGPSIGKGKMPDKKAILLVLPYLALLQEVLAELTKKFPVIRVAHVDTESNASVVYDKALQGLVDIIVITPEMLCKQKVIEYFSADTTKVRNILLYMFKRVNHAYYFTFSIIQGCKGYLCSGV